MTSSRKQLTAKIDRINKTLTQQQIKVKKHKKYFTLLVKNTNALVFLLPAFVIGWNSTKKNVIKNIIKYIMRVESLAFATKIGQKIIK